MEDFEKTINSLMNSLDVGFIWNFLTRKLKLYVHATLLLILMKFLAGFWGICKNLKVGFGKELFVLDAYLMV